MAEQRRPDRRRKLSPKEQKALEKQRQKQRELDRKRAKAEAKYREEARKQARMKGEDGHLVVTIPANFNEKRRRKKPQKPKKKTIPDIISAETDKRVRDMKPKDHADGYYVDEVKVRREQAEKQRKKRQKNQPRQLSPKQRRARRITIYTTLCICVLIIGVVLSLTVLFKAEHIVVKGNKYYDDSTIIELSGVAEGENIFVASMIGDCTKVEKTLPYVEKADVGFQIPGTIVINITHETPYLNLKSGKNLYLVSENARLLEKINKRKKGLMMVTAPALKGAKIGDRLSFKNSRATKALTTISQSLEANGIKGITAINVKEISNITITYDNRIKIVLGMPDGLGYKIRTAFSIIDKKLDPNKAGKIKGRLDVSQCNTTKKSYFNENIRTIKTPEPEQETTAPTETVASNYVTIPETTVPAYTETQGDTEPNYYAPPDETTAQAYTDAPAYQ